MKKKEMRMTRRQVERKSMKNGSARAGVPQLFLGEMKKKKEGEREVNSASIRKKCLGRLQTLGLLVRRAMGWDVAITPLLEKQKLDKREGKEKPYEGEQQVSFCSHFKASGICIQENKKQKHIDRRNFF